MLTLSIVEKRIRGGYKLLQIEYIVSLLVSFSPESVDGGWGRVLEYAEIWRSVLQVCVVQTAKNTSTLRLDFDTVSCQ